MRKLNSNKYAGESNPGEIKISKFSRYTYYPRIQNIQL